MQIEFSGLEIRHVASQSLSDLLINQFKSGRDVSFFVHELQKSLEFSQSTSSIEYKSMIISTSKSCKSFSVRLNYGQVRA